MNHCLSKPIEILLVEDSSSDVQVISKVFKQVRIPHHLRVVSDGVSAIAFLSKQGEYQMYPKPDLILLDLHLPKKDGLTVLQEIKCDRRFSHIPVIMLTASNNQKDIALCYQKDANCYLTKPNNLEELEIMVKMLQDFWLQAVRLPFREY